MPNARVGPGIVKASASRKHGHGNRANRGIIAKTNGIPIVYPPSLVLLGRPARRAGVNLHNRSLGGSRSEVGAAKEGPRSPLWAWLESGRRYRGNCGCPSRFA